MFYAARGSGALRHIAIASSRHRAWRAAAAIIRAALYRAKTCTLRALALMARAASKRAALSIAQQHRATCARRRARNAQIRRERQNTHRAHRAAWEHKSMPRTCAARAK